MQHVCIPALERRKGFKLHLGCCCRSVVDEKTVIRLGECRLRDLREVSLQGAHITAPFFARQPHNNSPMNS